MGHYKDDFLIYQEITRWLSVFRRVVLFLGHSDYYYYFMDVINEIDHIYLFKKNNCKTIKGKNQELFMCPAYWTHLSNLECAFETNLTYGLLFL